MSHFLSITLPALLLAGSLLAPHPTAAPPIVINEILAHTDPPDVDSVELTNQGDAPVDLSGWLMTDSLARPQAEWVRIADGTLLDPGEFYVIADCALGTILALHHPPLHRPPPHLRPADHPASTAPRPQPRCR